MSVFIETIFIVASMPKSLITFVELHSQSRVSKVSEKGHIKVL